jgi:hypothetical protein
MVKLKLFYADGGNHPVLGQVYHRCQEVSDGEEVARYQRYLANTLSGIAQTVEDCERILSTVETIETGHEVEAEIEGNAVDVTISKSGVQIDITVNDAWIGQPDGKFLFSEFRAAVEAWKRFLKLPETFDSEVTIEL